MARRRSGLQPVHLITAIAFLAAAAGAWWIFGRQKNERPAGNPFSAAQYEDNYIGMRGNKYAVTGTITKQLSFGSDSSRLFSMDVKDSGGAEPVPVPVLVPARFSSLNIQVGQEFQMSVLVDKDGVLKAEDIRKS